jgi:hypothetical protein
MRFEYSRRCEKKWKNGENTMQYESHEKMDLSTPDIIVWNTELLHAKQKMCQK